MNNKKKLILGLSALASIGGIIFGYNQYKNYKLRQKILKALKQFRYRLSIEFINVVSQYEHFVEKEKQKNPGNFSGEQVKNNIFKDQDFKKQFREFKVNALKNAQITEEEFSQAIETKFKNDKDIQAIMSQLTIGLDLALEGKRNCLQLKDYPKFGIKQFVKHQYELNKVFNKQSTDEELEKNVIRYAIDEGFNLEGYNPLYILFVNSEAYPQLMKEAVKLFVERGQKFAENPNQVVDDEKELQMIYKQLNIQD